MRNEVAVSRVSNLIEIVNDCHCDMVQLCASATGELTKCDSFRICTSPSDFGLRQRAASRRLTQVADLASRQTQRLSNFESELRIIAKGVE